MEHKRTGRSEKTNRPKPASKRSNDHKERKSEDSSKKRFSKDHSNTDEKSSPERKFQRTSGNSAPKKYQGSSKFKRKDANSDNPRDEKSYVKKTNSSDSPKEERTYVRKPRSFDKSKSEERPASRDTGFERKSPYSKKKQLEYEKKNYTERDTVRLNKFIANAGICSRREADDYIKSGIVKVNGVIVTEMGFQVKSGDEVKFSDRLLKQEKKVYILLNKPKDYVTTTDDPHAKRTVMELIEGACKERVYPVGRLDRNTTGVLLLTNDGDLAKKLTHPKYNKKKIYHAFLDKAIPSSDLVRLTEGIDTEVGFVQADNISYVDEVSKKEVGVEIHSGQNHVVKLMFEALGYKVTKLDRVYFAGLTKKNLPRGEYRFLSEKELGVLRMGAYE